MQLRLIEAKLGSAIYKLIMVGKINADVNS